MGTISVTGRGAVHVVADVTRVELIIAALFPDYDTAYVMAQANLKDLTAVMSECELSKELPKTIHFSIDKEFHNEYIDGEYTGKKIFDGYKLNQRIKIDLPINNVLLAKVVKGIGQRITNMELNIGYTVRDPRPWQLKMIERAVKDAKEKATLMAAAADCDLADVDTIRYNEYHGEFYSQARNVHDCEEAAGCDAESLDIAPDDLCGSETVDVVWYLKNKA